MRDIWKIGNTGVRNPMRIQDALRVYAESNLVGKIRSVDGASKLMGLLCAKGVLVNRDGNDPTGSYGRKFRFEFNANGLTYDQLKTPLNQSDFGAVDMLTPFGETFLAADTIPAVQECFLRANSLAVEPLHDGETFSPLRWTLAILLELEKQTGEGSLGFLEFAVCVQTSTPHDDVGDVVSRILKLRSQRIAANSKKKFDKSVYEAQSSWYKKQIGNFKDYGDMNLRYLRATGMVRTKGHGIALIEEKRTVAKALAEELIFDIPLGQRYQMLYHGAPLPTDDLDVAKKALADIKLIAKKQGVAYSIDDTTLGSVSGLNVARHTIEALLERDGEITYAHEQKFKWREISDYMDLVMKGGGTKIYDDDEDNLIKVPKDETPAYFEWCIWRAFLAMNTLKNKPYQIRRFKVDQDFMPVCTAPGNGPDLIAEYDKDVVAIEVTMSGGSRQEAMEGEPVRRHVANLISEYPGKNIHGLFVANKIDTNTAETFRNGIWYLKNDERVSLNIVPITLGQFKGWFDSIFTTGRHENGEILSLLSDCGALKSGSDAPTWKNKIATEITSIVAQKYEPVIAILSDVAESLRFREYLPVYSYRAACGKFGDGEAVEIEGWMKVDGRLDERMFVMRAAGRSMEPKIHDGDWCVFRVTNDASKYNGGTVLVQSRSISDPDSGGAYTIKNFSGEEARDDTDTRRWKSITLHPLNRDYEPIHLAPGDDVKVIAEFVRTV